MKQTIFATMIYDRLIKGESKLAVIGLGYVGLPIAMAFAKKIKVVGFDIHQERIDQLRQNFDSTNELSVQDFDKASIHFTTQITDLRQANCYIVATPTPIDQARVPDLTPLMRACETIGSVLKVGDLVSFESTVYPGCTEEECVPILERISGLKYMDDFKVAYSPERINPGDKEHVLHNVTKIVSGCDAQTLQEVAKIYELVVDVGVYRAKSIKVAEAAKVIENTQRDLNIALMNELAIIFHRIGINTQDVIEAASTKWNFLKFYPGLVGGHCIGVDPYYLTHKAMRSGYYPKVINSGRYVNESMGFYIGKQTVKKILEQGKNIQDTRILILGTTFKENIGDIRNSKVMDIISELASFQVAVDVMDPYASPQQMLREYNIALSQQINKKYDALIVAVAHKEYRNMTENDLRIFLKDDKSIIVDVKGIYNNKIKNTLYWSL